ncbi:alpha/beta hydrolase [Haloactinospora alba]|uniref:alpha/beta hydrolase n=1 Tax=Haloactinospora alba TaxID=405555 RepID=UPI001FE6CEE1|nr:alpha/beta hydrolase [Haloactinospora alba]
MRAAVRFLRTRAENYGLDPRAVGVWGASAGGHLAALTGLTGHLTTLPGETETGGSAAVQAVAESYAPADLASVAAGAPDPAPGDGDSPPEARLLGGHPAEVPERARRASPLAWVSAAAPPFQISHGTGDALVPHRQSERLHEALTAVGAPSELYLVEDYRHGFLNPGGRRDADTPQGMDDGRLETEGTAPALHRTSAAPNATGEGTTFGFDSIDGFLRRTLASRSASDPTPRSAPGGTT